MWSTAYSLHGHVPLRDMNQDFVRVMSSGATAVAAGIGFTIVLKDRSLWATGTNTDGQLGDGTRMNKDRFGFVRTFTGAGTKDVIAGGYHSIVLTQKGAVYATGSNKFGQLGDGTTRSWSSFAQVMSKGKKAIAMAAAAGDVHTMLLVNDGTVWSAGRNSNGQLGDGTTLDRSDFVKAMAGSIVLREVKALAAGGYHSLVLKEDDSVWATGSNE